MLTTVTKKLAASDPILKKITESLPPLEIEKDGQVFHDVMSCIIEQQIHYRSTKKVFQKMLAKSKLTILTPKNFTEFEKSFKDVKLSEKKYATIANILEFWDLNKIDWTSASNEEIYQKLGSINGIGKWTIEMILIYTLQRPDIFAFDDFHIKQIRVKLYKLDPKIRLKVQMTEIANLWIPHRSFAFRYLIEWKNQFSKNETF